MSVHNACLHTSRSLSSNHDKLSLTGCFFFIWDCFWGDTSKCIDLIRANVHRYGQALSNEDKRIIIQEIMDEIHQSAGRFLKHVGQRCLMEIAPAEAQRKVAHAIQYQQRATSRNQPNHQHPHHPER
jgi:hypothetical protein